MTAKEQLRERIEALTEDEAAETLRLLDQRSERDYPSVLPHLPGRAAAPREFYEHFGDLPTRAA